MGRMPNERVQRFKMLVFLSPQLPQARARSEARRSGSTVRPVMIWSEFLLLY
jgi:hypothetical protein